MSSQHHKYSSYSSYINPICMAAVALHQLLAWFTGSWLWSSGIVAAAFYIGLYGVLDSMDFLIMRCIPAPLYLLSYLIALPLRACGCLDEETLSIDDRTDGPLFFQDHPHCPRCNVAIPDEQCYLRGYVGHADTDSESLSKVSYSSDTHKVYVTAGYFHCAQCDDLCPGMERLVVDLGQPSGSSDGMSTTYTYKALPHFIKKWAYTGWRLCEPEEHANVTDVDYYGSGKDRKRQFVGSKKCQACGLKLNQRRHTLMARVRQWGPLNLVTNYLGIDECLNQRCRHREWVSRTVPF